MSSRSKGRDCNVQSYEDDTYGGYPEGTCTIKMPSQGSSFRAVHLDASGGHDDPKEAYRDRDAPSRVPREDIRKRTGWLPEAAASGGRFQSSDNCLRTDVLPLQVVRLYLYNSTVLKNDCDKYRAVMCIRTVANASQRDIACMHGLGAGTRHKRLV